MAYDCPDCGHSGEPARVDDASIVDGVLVECASCEATTVRTKAFASAHLEAHRDGVTQ